MVCTHTFEVVHQKFRHGRSNFIKFLFRGMALINPHSHTIQFIDGETEARKVEVTCQELDSWLVTELEPKARSN